MLTFLHRMLEPKTYPVDAPRRAPEVLATWLRYSPDAQPEHRDWEDWAENAVMLHAADVACGGAVRILDAGPNIRTSGDRTPMIQPNPSAPPAFMYGRWKDSDSYEFPRDVHMVGSNAETVKAVVAYPSSPVFQAAAGRRFIVCDAERAQLEAALVELHNAGHREVFIKTRFKQTAKRFSLPDEPVGLWSAIERSEEFEWFLVQHEGMKQCLFIQEAFVPTKEYRMIIVGDRPVTGAGCIEHFTPIDNPGVRFDERVEPIRNESDEISDPDTIARYAAFAEAYALTWATAHGANMIYSLDLAVDGRTGNIVAIEMNPMLNLGLYATNADLLVQQIARVFG
jgi:hypothetical protein